MAECMVRDRLPELWQKIDNAHFSYLETDDCLEKLDQRRKLEGYIMDYLCLVPHERKFRLPETSQVFQKSAIELADFSGYRAAAGWAALAQYAGNLLAQPWRKEYRIIRLYSGFFKHEVEANLAGGEVMLRAMGYYPTTAGTLELDGPICPDLVAAVSRDSLIAYVECQLMKAVWEELCRRGCSRGWRDVLAQRQRYAGDARCAIAALLPSTYSHRDSRTNTVDDNLIGHKPSKNLSMQSCGRQSLMAQQAPVYQTIDNYGHTEASPTSAQQTHCNEQLLPTCLPSSQYQSNQVEPQNPQRIPPSYCQNSTFLMHPLQNLDPNTLNAVYSYGPTMIQQYPIGPNYLFTPMNQHPCVVPYSSFKQAMHGYHCMPNTESHSNMVPTGLLIELDTPVHQPYHQFNKSSQNGTSTQTRQKVPPVQASHNRTTSSDNVKSAQHHNNRRHDLNGDKMEANHRSNTKKEINPEGEYIASTPRSDARPKLKAKEDGMGTFESWDYVFKNLERQGYSKDLGARGDLFVLQSDRDSRTFDRIKKDKKQIQQTAMYLEDAMHLMSIEKSSDEDSYRTAKINEMLLRMKLDNDARLAKVNARKQILTEEREKRKTDTSTSPIPEKNVEIKITDKTRLISKEDARDKKEIDKLTYVNGHGKKIDLRKPEKSNANCFSVSDKEREKSCSRRKTVSEVPVTPSTSKAGLSQTSKKKSLPDNLPASRASSSHVTSQNLFISNGQPAERTSPDPSLRLVVTLKERDTVDSGPQPRRSVHEIPKSIEVKPTMEKRSLTKKTDSLKWECSTCTYLNTSNIGACEMCGKSRTAGAEIVPLMSGGRECPACTLVNGRDATTCEACNSSLKYSPTYI